MTVWPLHVLADGKGTPDLVQEQGLGLGQVQGALLQPDVPPPLAIAAAVGAAAVGCRGGLVEAAVVAAVVDVVEAAVEAVLRTPEEVPGRVVSVEGQKAAKVSLEKEQLLKIDVFLSFLA